MSIPISAKKKSPNSALLGDFCFLGSTFGGAKGRKYFCNRRRIFDEYIYEKGLAPIPDLW